MLFVCVGAAGAAACAAGADPQRPRSLVRFTGGPFGRAFSEEFGRALPDVSFGMVQSVGTVENIQALQRGAADVGLAFADVAYVTYNEGRNPRAMAVDELRGLAVVQLTPLQVMVRPGSQVTSVGELRGARVALGQPGSGMATTAELVLEAYGLSPNDLQPVYLPFMEAGVRLAKGELDAAFAGSTYPALSVRFATREGARLLEVVGGPVDRLRTEYPFFRLARIPPGSYAGHNRTVRTIGIDSILLCRADLDEMLVYRLTKAFFDMLPALSGRLEALRTMDVERAPATPIPLHAGAARYYRERELYR
jgi:TRAP transporter TAXI family solute receptor